MKTACFYSMIYNSFNETEQYFKEEVVFMDSSKLETISNLFEGKEIRSIWDSEKEEYFFSVVDVVGALTDSKIPRNYWSDLKRKLKQEGS